jgi:AraC-like DNA-binding protein
MFGDTGIPCDLAELPLLLLRIAETGGADTQRLAREAHIPAWAMSARHVMVPTRLSVHLFELVEHALRDPDVALRIPSRLQIGDLDLLDYLFTTAPTLRDALRASADYNYLVSTNSLIDVGSEADGESSYAFRLVQGAGRGRELMLQLGVAIMCARVRAGTGQPVRPVRVGFAFPAPRRYRVITETLGASQVDFDCPVTTFTFRDQDLDLPMTGADGRLHQILDDHARMLPPPVASWHEHFQLVLDSLVTQGPLPLKEMAARLGVSARTLQRQLAEQDTTWRAELDASRHRIARQAGPVGMAELADRVGYADPRSARRWRNRTLERNLHLESLASIWSLCGVGNQPSPVRRFRTARGSGSLLPTQQGPQASDLRTPPCGGPLVQDRAE